VSELLFCVAGLLAGASDGQIWKLIEPELIWVAKVLCAAISIWIISGYGKWNPINLVRR
jgi:hypothetical protein